MIHMKRHLDFDMDGGRVWTSVQFLTSENTIFISFYTAFKFVSNSSYSPRESPCAVTELTSLGVNRYLNPFPDLLDII